MKPYLLIDFGSTFTKITAVDLTKPTILGRATALTTVKDGLLSGYQNALTRLIDETGVLSFEKKLACSSAAGGLKIVAVGLVPELTVEAAKRAALGAGGRVLKTYGFELTKEDLQELIALKPDLILLAGGTDGGNQENLLHNSRILADSNLKVPIILAGNRSIAPQAESIIKEAGKECIRVANVLPNLREINIEPAQQSIRELFFKRIIQAKGLDQVESELDGIIMPTPAAVLQAACCLADGAEKPANSLGELLLIDIGGATTDVHSVADGLPSKSDVYLRGLPESRVKRTVEGDLGMRYSAPAIVEAFSLGQIGRMTGLTEEQISDGIARRAIEVGFLPESAADWLLEEALGFLAVKGAVERHAGRLEKAFTPQGVSYIQTGKDLTALKTVIGTGGILANSPLAGKIIRGVLFDPGQPESLMPLSPDLYLDRQYLIPTLGLIAKEHPAETFRLLKNALEKVS